MKKTQRLWLSAFAALVLIGAINVPAAFASTSGFVAGEYPAKLKGVDFGGVGNSSLTMFGVTYDCRPPTLVTATQSEPSSSIVADTYPSLGTCWAPGVGMDGAQTMQMNGCKFTFDTKEAGAAPGTIGIGPPGCGPITVNDMYSSCKAWISPSASFSGVPTYFGVGPSEFGIETTLTNLKVTLSGPYPECSEATETAVWKPDWKITAENLSGKSLSLRFAYGVYLEGKASEKESERPRFASANYPRNFSGGGFTFIQGATPITCEESKLVGGTGNGPTTSVLLDATYGKCTTLSGAWSVEVLMHSCDYTLTALNVGPPYSGSFGIGCLGKDKIEYKGYTKEGTLVCTLKLGPQSGLSSVAMSNVGPIVDSGIALNANVEGVAWERSGSSPLCSASSGTNGRFTGTPTLVGFS